MSYPLLDDREQHFIIHSCRDGLSLFLRYLPSSAQPSKGVKPALYIHGATFPSALSFAYRFARRSWRDELCDAGFDVWRWIFMGLASRTDILKWTSRQISIFRSVEPKKRKEK